MGVILWAHPIRGELHIQHNTNRKVTTTTLPFYNELHRLHVHFVNMTRWTMHIGEANKQQSIGVEAENDALKHNTAL